MQFCSPHVAVSTLKSVRKVGGELSRILADAQVVLANGWTN
jgi:hypothetical protein